MILHCFYGNRRKIRNILVSSLRLDNYWIRVRKDNCNPFQFIPERMTGHQQLINCVQFSPDARIIASASFDKSIKLWDGKTGKYEYLGNRPHTYSALKKFYWFFKMSWKFRRFITTLHGHVQAVYMIAWSSDSRLLVSGSADSTLKGAIWFVIDFDPCCLLHYWLNFHSLVWDRDKKKIIFDLPGHADEVYAVDWSPDGKCVVSGGKDKVLKLWHN